MNKESPPTVELLDEALDYIRSTTPRIVASPASTPEPGRASVALIIRVVPSPHFPLPSHPEEPPEEPPKLSDFFRAEWVNDPNACPELLFVCREYTAEASVAFPGGRHAQRDGTQLDSTLDQTWQETGIDLTELCYTCVGQLDDREITTSMGKRLLMVVSSFVFLQLTPHAPSPDPVASASLHWTPVATLVSLDDPLQWSNVTVNAALLSPKHSAFLRILLPVFLGSMQVRAVVLQPSTPNPEVTPKTDTQESKETALSSSKPKQLKLWGMSLAITIDFIAYMNGNRNRNRPYHGFTFNPLFLTKPSSTTPPFSPLMEIPYQFVAEDYRMEYIAPSLASGFPRFSYPDANFWMWVFGKRYREVIRVWEVSIREGENQRLYWPGFALNTFYAAIRKTLAVVVVERALGVLLGISFVLRWKFRNTKPKT